MQPMKGWPQNWSVNVVNMSLSCWMLCACTGLFSCIHVYIHYVYPYKKLINSIIFILCATSTVFFVVVPVEPSCLSRVQSNRYLVRYLVCSAQRTFGSKKHDRTPYTTS